MNELQGSRAISAVVLFLLTLMCGVLPVAFLRYWYKRRNSTKSVATAIANSRFAQLIMFFGGGVLIATAFCHLIPEAREQWDAYVEKHHLDGVSIFGITITKGDAFDHAAHVGIETNEPHDHDHPPVTTVPNVTEGSEGAGGGGKEEGHGHEDGVPIVEIAICTGFFAIYLLEELMHSFFGHSHARSESDSASQTALVTASGAVTPIGHGMKYSTSSSHGHPSHHHNHAHHHHHHHGHAQARNSQNSFMTTCQLHGTESSTDLVLAEQSAQDEGTGSQLSVGHACRHEGCTNEAIEMEHEKQCLRHRTPTTSPLPTATSPTPVGLSSHYGTVIESVVCSSSSSSSRSTTSSSLPIPPPKEPLLARFIRGLVVIVAFAIHSVFDGVAIGLQKSPSQVYALLGAIFCHKFIIAAVLGMDLYSTTRSLLLTAIHIALFSIMSPIGILLVMFLEGDSPKEGENATLLILQALAIGTVLYIAFFEILQEDHSQVSAKNRISGLLKWAAMLVGFLVMLMVLLFVSHE